MSRATLEADATGVAVDRAPPRRAVQLDRVAVALLMALAGAGTALARVHPTGAVVSDVVVSLGVGAFVVYAASRANAWACVVAAAVAAAASEGAMQLFMVVVLVTASVDMFANELPGRRAVRAFVGCAVMLAVVDLDSPSAAGAALVATVAIGCLVVSGRAAIHSLLRRTPRGVLVAVAIVIGAAVFLVAASALFARHSIEVGIDRSHDGLAAARQGKSEEAQRLFEEATTAFESANAELGGWWTKPARALPIVGQHARALEDLAAMGDDLADAAAHAAADADVQSLRVRRGRLDLDQVRAMANPLDSVTSALERASELASHATSPWLIGPVADRVDDFTRTVAKATESAQTAATGVRVLPDALGGSGPRRYFVAFANPSEARDLGGFVGAYGILTADDGKLTLSETNPVVTLNRVEKGRRLIDRASYPARFRAAQPDVFWQNVTATSDFPTVARAISQLWPDAAGPIDGVIYIDPGALAAMLDLTGPVTVRADVPALTSATAADFVLRDQYSRFTDEQGDDLLVELADAVFDGLTSGDLPAPAELGDVLSSPVEEHRLMVHSFHAAEHDLFRRLRIDGGLPATRGDFLAVRESNRGLNKLDAYLRRTVSYDADVDPVRNLVQSTVTIELRNDAPSSGLPEGVAANHVGQPPGTNSTTVAVLSPLRLVDVTSGGASIGRGAFQEYGRWAYTAQLDVPAQTTVTVTFQLEGEIDLRDGYHLDVAAQPLANPDRLRVDVRGPLDRDEREQRPPATEVRADRAIDVTFGGSSAPASDR